MTQAPVSVQLYTVRDTVASDLSTALERLAGLGFRNVELFGFVDRADEYAELLPRFGLSAPTAHASLVNGDVDATFAAAKKVGVQTVIDPHIPAEKWRTREDVEATASALASIATRAADHGLKVGYHNHWWELEERIDGTPALEVLADALPAEVVLELDTYWSEVGGVPAADLLKRLGDRVVAIHVKDGPVSRDNKQQKAVGGGSVDVLGILEAAPQALRVVELDDYDGEVWDALAASVVFLRENGVEL